LIIEDPKVLYQEALKLEEIVHILNYHKNMINSMQISFSMGFRILFVMIPFIFFVAGPLPFILAAMWCMCGGPTPLSFALSNGYRISILCIAF
jgi:hypothetical protein